MRCDAEAKTGPVWASESDPRVTMVGRLLRSMHLDELPQLINVLRREMCLIGPRPERPEIAEWLEREIPCYNGRLSIPPGITGLSQVSLPADSDVETVRKKLALDLAYIQHRAVHPLLDVRILAATALRLSGFSRPTACRICGLDGIAPASIASDVHTEEHRWAA
jgi:lipopolysaccharide/colanic/teichoic acid biosynthesis glycosyltransferase